MQRLLSFIVIFAVSIHAPGCRAGSGDNATASASAPLVSPSQASSAAPRASAAKARSKAARHGGIASGLFRAAHELELTVPQQDSLDKIEVDLKADDETIRAVMAKFRADLVACVRAGKLDTAKLTADEGFVETAIADHQSKESDALDSLHTLLDAAQRATLVASVRARQAEHESRMTGWMKAKNADGGARDWNKQRLDRLTVDLALDTSQEKQVAAILARASGPPSAATMQSRWSERRKRADALLTDFTNDAFDAKTLDLTVLPGKTAREPMDHIVGFLAQVLPLLYADQRDKFATSLDRPFGGFGRPGPQGAAPSRSPLEDIAFPFAEPVESPAEEPSSPAH